MTAKSRAKLIQRSRAKPLPRSRGNPDPARRSLPNLLVPIDLRDGEPTLPSLFALSEGRRVAHVAGATVFAIVFTESRLPEAVAAQLGRAGADKVLLCEGAGLGAPPLDATHGAALYAAVERVPPLLVLFPAGGPGLAARLGGAFAAVADLEVGEAAVSLADGVGRVFIRRWRGDHTGYRRIDPVELERPVVAVMPAGGPPADLGTGDVEIEVIECLTPPKAGVVELDSEADDQAAVALASVLVTVDPALGPDALAALAAAAPAGVTVVDPTAAPAGLAAAAPRLAIAVGARELRLTNTPRGRVAVVAPPGGAPPRPSADVLWPVPPSGGAFWTELAAGLGALAPGAASAAPPKVPSGGPAKGPTKGSSKGQPKKPAKGPAS